MKIENKIRHRARGGVCHIGVGKGADLNQHETEQLSTREKESLFPGAVCKYCGCLFMPQSWEEFMQDKSIWKASYSFINKENDA